MILSFSKDQFKERILNGQKRQTIRADKLNRWKIGSKIQFWRGSPRNCRGKNKPYQFAGGVVENVESIFIDFEDNAIMCSSRPIYYKENDLNNFAIADGFDSWQELKEWFNCKFFIGRIIYFKIEYVIIKANEK